LVSSILLFLFAGVSYGMPILPGSSSNGLTWTLNNTDEEGTTRQATAIFDTVTLEGYLLITVTNTASASTTPNQMLAGVFFDYDGALMGVPHVSADRSDVRGSYDPPPDSAGRANLDGEYGYLTGVGGNNFTGADYVISANALDPDLDPSPDGWPGVSDPINPSIAIESPSPNGADWSLVGASKGGSSSIPSHCIQSSVQIIWDLTGETGEFSNVHFVYGTNYVAHAPEPATMLLVGTG
jgi:hypothetical protein